MSDTVANLQRKISSAGDLQSVVRTMKALAASSIGQYENAVSALGEYNHAVELGLGLCFRNPTLVARGAAREARDRGEAVRAVVFGSDQGLVGQFNDVVADFAIKTLAALPGKPRVWAVGERVRARLADAGLSPLGLFRSPSSVGAITPLVGQIQVETASDPADGEYAQLYVFHNRPHTAAVYEPTGQRLLPLDAPWTERLAGIGWPTNNLAELVGAGTTALRAFIREYLFISLFRACAESLAGENASRLAAMQRAEKNISELLETLRGAFNRLRQTGIDEELFDVVSGYEALSAERTMTVARRGSLQRSPEPVPPATACSRHRANHDDPSDNHRDRVDGIIY